MDDPNSLLLEHNFKTIGSDFPIQRVLQMIALGLRLESVWVCLNTSDRLLVAASNRADDCIDGDFCGIPSQVIGSAKPFLVEDAATSDGALARQARNQQLGAFSCYPLFRGQMEAFGALCASDPKPRAFSAADKRLLSDGVRVIEDILALRAESIRDPLTGCFNRRYFDEQLVNELRRNRRLELPLTIAMVDLDHFKALNDSAGHAAGDNALRMIGHCLRKAFRRAGDLACRIGGEEFALVLPGTDRETAALLLNRCLGEIRALQIDNPGSPDGTLTASIGYTSIEHISLKDDMVLGSHIAAADKALYAAKAAGRDRIECRDFGERKAAAR